MAQLYYRDVFLYTAAWSDTCAGLNGNQVTRRVTNVLAKSGAEALAKLRKRRGGWMLVDVQPKGVQMDLDGNPDHPAQYCEEPLVEVPPIPPERAGITGNAATELKARAKAIAKLSGAG